MSDRREPFWGWPGWGLLRFTLGAGLATALWFGFIYGGAEFLTANHARRVRLHLDSELAVPFVPAAVAGYLSIYPLFWSAPFILRQRRPIAALCLALAAATFCGGICFLLFPADDVFPPPDDLGAWAGLVRFAKTVALPHNFMPSLHVALSTTCVLAYGERAGQVGKMWLWLWAAVIGASTVLLHQHYLLDVLTGYALAWAAFRYVYRPLLSAPPGPMPCAESECPSYARRFR